MKFQYDEKDSNMSQNFRLKELSNLEYLKDNSKTEIMLLINSLGLVKLDNEGFVYFINEKM